jgi:transketolase
MTLQNPREIYGRTLVELGKENPNIVVLEGDLGKSTMTCYFEQAFPQRFFEMGIAEANMTSFAGGLSLTGKIPYTNSFAVFAAGRSYDQIRQGVCLPKLNVKIVGSSAGLSDYGDGSTHQTIEDLALMRAVPNLTVLVPCDGTETRKMTRAIAAYHGPVYMRLTRNDVPAIFPDNEEFVIGKPYLVRDGTDVVVFACGQMVSKALEAADLDEAALKAFAVGMKGIVTAEEHSIMGGLSCVINYVFRGSGLRTECIAINDRFGQSASNYEELIQEYGLSPRHIFAALKKVASV